LRADAEVVVFAADGRTEQVRFVLTRCLPVKLKAPALNAKDGMVAVEELQLAYESLTMKRPGGSSPAGGLGAGSGARASVAAAVSIAASADLSLSGSAKVSIG